MDLYPSSFSLSEAQGRGYNLHLSTLRNQMYNQPL